MSDPTFGQRLGLVFEENTEGPLMQPPTFAQIYVQTFTTARRTGFNDEPIQLVSAVCVTADEFDYQADQIIENLKRLKREARAKFNAARRDELERLALSRD